MVLIINKDIIEIRRVTVLEHYIFKLYEFFF